MDDVYCYTPLPTPRSIRILRVFPVDDNSDDIICEIETLHLDEDSVYSALSYSWGMNDDGDSSFCRKIIVDWRKKKVTRNLYEGLLRLRNLKQPDPLRIWIDAVCIDQGNLAERSAQVAMMHEIFTKANEVLVWLGEGKDPALDECAAAVIMCMGIKGPGYGAVLHEVHPSHVWTAHDGTASSICQYRTTDYITDEQCSHIEKAPREIYSRRYFSRRWTAQEVCQPTVEHIHLQFGKHSVSMDDFLKSGETFEFSGRPSNVRLHVLWRRIYQQACARRHLGCLPKLLRSLGSMVTTDPRDILYAVLSMDRSYNVRPDYNLSVAETFAQYAYELVRRGEIDQLFSMLGHPYYPYQFNTVELNLPSWVPDLRNPGGGVYDTERIEESELVAMNAQVISWNILEYSPIVLLVLNNVTKVNHRQSPEPFVLGRLSDDDSEEQSLFAQLAGALGEAWFGIPGGKGNETFSFQPEDIICTLTDRWTEEQPWLGFAPTQVLRPSKRTPGTYNCVHSAAMFSPKIKEVNSFAKQYGYRRRFRLS